MGSPLAGEGERTHRWVQRRHPRVGLYVVCAHCGWCGTPFLPWSATCEPLSVVTPQSDHAKAS